MKRILSMFMAFIMAVTIFVIPIGTSYAEDEIPATSEQSIVDESESDPITEPSLIEDCDITLEGTSYSYTGVEIKPAIIVKNNENLLIEGSDYTVVYSDNINVGEASVQIVGEGTYTGTVTKTFNIVAADLSNADVALSYRDSHYYKRNITPNVTVKLGGVVVDPSNYTVKYSNNKYPGTATVAVTGKKNFKSTTVKENFYIGRITSYKATKINRKSIKLTWSYKKNVTGYKVYQYKSGKWKLIKTIKGRKNNTYTISKLTPGTNYKFRVRAYVKSGVKTYYGGYKDILEIHTRPSQVTISSVSRSADLSAKVTWKKRNASGYVMQLSRYSDFRNYTSYTTSSSVNYKTVTGLADGKKYYVRVRAYKTSKYGKSYGSWSKTKSFTATDTGWLTKNGKKYYCVNGKYQTGYHKISGEQYYFEPSTGEWVALSSGMWNKVKNQSSGTNWLIAVSRNSRRICVYNGSSGNWKLKYYWKCTVGAKSTPTPTGVYRVPSTNTYQRVFGRKYGYSCWYSTRITKGYLFHSVLYQPGSKTKFVDGRLGYALSHGCIRVSLTNAKWIQDNIKPGTTVIIY